MTVGQPGDQNCVLNFECLCMSVSGNPTLDFFRIRFFPERSPSEAAPAAREMGYRVGRSCRTLGHLLSPRELGKARWRGWDPDGAQPERHLEDCGIRGAGEVLPPGSPGHYSALKDGCRNSPFPQPTHCLCALADSEWLTWVPRSFPRGEEAQAKL